MNTDRNLWFDYGLGRGGNIIALAGVLYASDHVPYLLGKIAEQAPHIRPISFSFRQQASEPSFQHLEVRDLTHPALLRYLQGRGINIELAKRECKELQNPDGSSKCTIFVGGAVLTKDYAMKIGADYYCRDAKESVDTAKLVLG